MIELKKLSELVTDVSGMFKKWVKMKDGEPVISEKADFHETYRLSVSYRNRVKTHAEISVFPDHLFEARSPNMTQKEFDYIKGNYKQNTLPVYTDYNTTISRMWADGNWSINHSHDQEKDEESFQHYIDTKIKLFGSIENYYKSLITHLATVDPNGLVAVTVESIETVLDENGEVLIDDTKLFEPQPVFFRCDQILYRVQSEQYLVLLDEYSVVEYGNKNVKAGFVMEFYDDANIYRITQYGKWTDWTFKIELKLEHNYGKVLACELGGIVQLVKNKIVNQSPFLYACDNLDLALMNAQYKQVSIANSCFPYRVMVGATCDHSEKDDESGQVLYCQSGIITYPNQTRRPCSKCNGSGLKDRVSPMGVLLLSKEDWSGSGDKAFADRAMYYVSPDVDALKFVVECIEKDVEASRKILHLQTSNSNLKGTENLTATGMGLDQKTQYAFIKPISDRLFYNFQYIIDAMGWVRYGEQYKAPIITYPSTFDYNTEGDYLVQISNAQKAGVPSFIIHTIFYKFLQTLYFYEKKTNDIFRLIVSSDRILVMSNEDVNLKFSRNLIEKWEVILHDSAITFVDDLLMEDAGFFEQDLSKQIEALQQKAKDKAAEITVQPSPLQTNLVNDIVGA